MGFRNYVLAQLMELLLVTVSLYSNILATYNNIKITLRFSEKNNM